MYQKPKSFEIVTQQSKCSLSKSVSACLMRLSCILSRTHACLLPFALGGSDAPELNPVLLNIVINGVGIAGTSWLFQRDLKARQRDRSSVEREEALARLQVGYLSMHALPYGHHLLYASYL